MISVSPPQKGVAPESKVDKDFRNTSVDSKAEFEKTLKDKMLFNKEATKQSERNKLKQEAKDGEKEKLARNEDSGSKTERKEKKAPGGIKKKVAEVDDDKMVSNIMASQESEIEIPESKIDLAEIEVGIENQNSNMFGTPNQESATALVEQATASSMQTAQAPAAIDAMQMKAMQLEAMLEGEGLAIAEESMPQAEMPSENVIAQEMPAAQSPAEAAKAAQVKSEAGQLSAMQLEKELGEEVGFQSEAKTQAGVELVQKMKAFEVEKNLSPDKAQAFELAVLDQLKKQMSDIAGQDQSSGQSGSRDESGKDSLKDLKSEMIKSDSSLHAGQSHTDFKTNLTSSIEKSAEASQAKNLEENHEQNVKEIMSQAKYLVTKGGGEMKVSMSPEGMGEIQLKVLLQDGKLNVEIQTQDKAVKKMIEDSLSELKSGLAAHRLSVEHVRIDTVNATNTENNAQAHTNLNQGGSEGKQREFWNQFQQNLGQQPNRSAYQSGSSAAGRANSSASNATEAPSSTLRTYGGTKGASVNRVA